MKKTDHPSESTSGQYRSAGVARVTSGAQSGSGSDPKLSESSPCPTGKALAVLDAARDVFLTHGFSAATTDMIQQAAGVSKATVYAHYPTKEALFAAVIERQCAMHMDALRAGRSVSGGIQAVLAEMANAYLDFGLAPSGLALFRVAAAEAIRFPELARTFYEKGPKVYCTIVAEHLERAVQAKELDLGTMTTQEAAAVFFSLVRGHIQLQSLLLSDRPATAAQRKRWANLALETFFKAFGTR
ncbi:hypothetical protein CAL20_18560 [Bordetella genomosp. 4]|uniref:HTH tetR-type domain-containing protein n=1 Tax=Bordetella genomosp. 4 TaxID=463044 RepID=A0A261TZE9_9BORD|nr:hypothetical protein CAL20_18560 [Bordetella genomosp. 4]